jgi:membrane protease YdiL (CAAX protease family)
MQLPQKISTLLRTSKIAGIVEILFVFLVALSFIWLLNPLTQDQAVLTQAVIWISNLLMLMLIWAGMRLRGESWNDFGLRIRSVTLVEGLKYLGIAFLVLFVTLIAYGFGSVIMVNITGIPESADMSQYAYMQENFLLFILTVLGVLVVSSFGEEVIYRAFLINRIVALGNDSQIWKGIAVILSAVIFGLVHYKWGAMGMVQTGFMGLSLGFFYLKLNKNLWILILAHAIMDITLMIQLYLGYL